MAWGLIISAVAQGLANTANAYGTKESAQKQKEVAMAGITSTEGISAKNLEAQKLAFEQKKKIWEETHAAKAPWQEAGVEALGGLEGMSYTGELKAPKDFETPSQEWSLEDDPAYKARMAAGMEGIDLSKFTPQEIAALAEWMGNEAQKEWRNAYGRAGGRRAAKYGAETDRFNREYGAEKDRLARELIAYGKNRGRLESLAGLGLTQTGGTPMSGTDYGKGGMQIGNTLADYYKKLEDIEGQKYGAYGNLAGEAGTNSAYYAWLMGQENKG